VQEARAEEASLKGQWRLTQRLQCLLGAMTPGGAVDRDALGKCVAITLHSMDHLSHTYPKFPTEPTCTRPKVGPDSERYNRTVYSNLPVNIMVRKPPSVACSILVADGRFENCGGEKQLMVGRNIIERCGSKPRWLPCKHFFQEKHASRLAVFGGDFFLMVDLHRGEVKKCPSRLASVDYNCGVTLREAGTKATIIPKTGTSFYLSENQKIMECDLEKPNLGCEERLKSTKSIISFAIDLQDGEFLLGHKKSVEKCTKDKKCTDLGIPLDAGWSMREVAVDIDGDYLISQIEYIPGVKAESKLLKCPRSSPKACDPVGSGMDGGVTSLIPQKEYYLVLTESIGSNKGRLYRCARKAPHICTTAGYGGFGMAEYCPT